jgi:hypothetical protein
VPCSDKQPDEAATTMPDDRGGIERIEPFDLVGNQGGTFLRTERCQGPANPFVDTDLLERGGVLCRDGGGRVMVGSVRGEHALAQPGGRSFGVAQLGNARHAGIDRVGGQHGRPRPIAERNNQREPVKPCSVQLSEGGAFLGESCAVSRVPG